MNLFIITGQKEVKMSLPLFYSSVAHCMAVFPLRTCSQNNVQCFVQLEVLISILTG